VFKNGLVLLLYFLFVVGVPGFGFFYGLIGSGQFGAEDVVLAGVRL
jgi:hypothetical protein